MSEPERYDPEIDPYSSAVNPCPIMEKCSHGDYVTYADYQSKLEAKTSMLKAYQRAVNLIDDYFEYGMESETDQKFVHDVLKELTATLLGIIERKDH